MWLLRCEKSVQTMGECGVLGVVRYSRMLILGGGRQQQRGRPIWTVGVRTVRDLGSEMLIVGKYRLKGMRAVGR